MYDEYMAKLLDVRWARSAKFRPSAAEGTLQIDERDLYFLYDTIIAFNRPVYNDPLIASLFKFQTLEAALASGKLEAVLSAWEAP